VPTSNQRFLQPQLLAQLATMQLRAATVVEGVMGGLHRSPYRGLSIEFSEYRRYQPGDEPKRIDWKAYARSDRYVVKEYEDETNLDATLILDASASMGFGSEGNVTKWQYGGILAASLAYLLQLQQDAVGLVVLDENIRIEMPPKNTRSHLIETIGQLETVEPERQTRLAEVLHRVAGKAKRRGMVILVSDLLADPEDVLSALQHFQFSGNDVIVFHTLDPVEIGFDFEGPSVFVDPETNDTVSALAEDVKEQYLKAIRAFLENYSEQMGKTNISYVLTDTSQPLDQALLSFLNLARLK
jgi:uncharacterized protein (DUF58 family)